MNFTGKTQNLSKAEKSCSTKILHRDKLCGSDICLSMDSQSIAQIISNQMMKEVHRSLKARK